MARQSTRLLISRYWSGILSQGMRGTLTVWRKRKNHDFSVTVVELAADKVATSLGGGKKPKNEQVANALGLIVSDLTDTNKKDLNIDGGIQVDSAEGSVARGGLLQCINNTDIKDVRQFNVLWQPSWILRKWRDVVGAPR